MDLIDKQIILELMGNCRTTYRSIGKKLGLSSLSARKRVMKLRESGLISRGLILLSLAILEAEHCIAFLSIDGTERDEELVENIGKNGDYQTANNRIVGEWVSSSYQIHRSLNKATKVQLSEVFGVRFHIEYNQGINDRDELFFNCYSRSGAPGVGTYFEDYTTGEGSYRDESISSTWEECTINLGTDVCGDYIAMSVTATRLGSIGGMDS
jgi:DNA-binding Lrp family transcriptional regulator